MCCRGASAGRASPRAAPDELREWKLGRIYGSPTAACGRAETLIVVTGSDLPDERLIALVAGQHQARIGITVRVTASLTMKMVAVFCSRSPLRLASDLALSPSDGALTGCHACGQQLS